VLLWRFGISVHIGIYDTFELIYSIDTRAANVSNIVAIGKLMCGGNQPVAVNTGYLGIQKWGEHKVCRKFPSFLPNRLGLGRNHIPAG